MYDHVGHIDGLVLRVRGSVDVGKLDEFFDGGKDGRDQLSRMVSHLLDYAFALEEFVTHQIPTVFL